MTAFEKYSKGDTLETVVYTLKEIRMIENQLNERNIIIKKWYMHACDKKKYINCGKILPAEIYWFNCYQLLSTGNFFKNKIHLDTQKLLIKY